MKITIDTSKKLLSFEGTILFKDLTEFVKEHGYEDYNIELKSETNWNSPVLQAPYIDNQPWEGRKIWYENKPYGTLGNQTFPIEQKTVTFNT